MKDGDVITVNGKPCRIEAGALVPVEVKKGPFGGEMKKVDDCQIGDIVYVSAIVERSGVTNNKTIQFTSGVFVETNIPPRPKFIQMTAGEAAKMYDIVGRWVAVKVGKFDDSISPLGVANTENGHSWLDYDAEILMIEGVDLP